LLSVGLDYFKDNWNVFDFTILIITMGSTIVTSFLGTDNKSANASNITSIVRVFRLFRVFRLINRA
jgi:hypothetical protein